MCSKKPKRQKPKMGIINFGACPKDWDHILLIGQLKKKTKKKKKKKKKPHPSIHHQRKTTKLWQLEAHHENTAKNKGLNMKRGMGSNSKGDNWWGGRHNHIKTLEMVSLGTKLN